MKYFRFHPQLDGFSELRFREDDFEFSDLFDVGVPILPSNRQIPSFVLSEGTRDVLHDFPSIGLGIFAFSGRAWKVLSPHLGLATEAVPLTGLPVDYFAINVLKILPALNAAASEILFFPNGSVDRITKYVMRSEIVNNALMFRIPERHTDVFISEVFLELVDSFELIGLQRGRCLFEV